MKLHELKSLLQRHPGHRFQLQLPDGHAVPVNFHITEVGHVRKTFLDCGGQMHQSETCQLQAWVAENDEDHRLASRKLLGILEKAAGFLPGDHLPVEIEYEHLALTQYPVAAAEIRDDAVVLQLESKHTDCLAKELCTPRPAAATSGCGCAPGACCS
jgi:hypothetical protein